MKNNVDRYLDNLIVQFIQATGYKNKNVNSVGFKYEFLGWIEERKKISNKYLKLLDYMNLTEDIDKESSVEVGKGKYDTIVRSFKTNRITPYVEDLDEERTMNAIFKVMDGQPTLITNNGLNIARIESNIPITFITQNPYNESLINGWSSLHNMGLNNIVVGMYGNINDKDMEQKIETLKALKDKLLREYQEEFSILDDSYCYAIASKTKKNIKNK